ncbi:MAG: hypothetical protein LBI42_12905 [Chitinispirillales bacterium]|jgi:uncharacterized membrane protein|nr:hypothetical protein [Chitinispirillales bacterium]
MAERETIRVDKSIEIQRMPSDLYAMWRIPENLTLILDFLEEVESLDEKRSRWSILLDNSEYVSWDTEITEDVKGQLIRWHSGNNADALHDGLVTFSSTGRAISTLLHLRLNFFFPSLGDNTDTASMEDLSVRIEEDLQRFKMAAEANEFPVKHREGRRGLPWGFSGSTLPREKNFPIDE